MSDLARGIFCTIACTFFFGCMDVCAKYLSARYDPFFVVWARYVVPAVLTLLIFAPKLKILLRAQKPLIQIARSALLFVTTLLFFWSLSMMPLSQVMAVAQTAPVMITGLAALLLGEKIGLHRSASVMIGLLGALIILRPGFGDAGLETMLPLLGALGFASYSIATRFLGAHDSQWTTFIYTALVGAATATLFLPFFWSPVSNGDIPIFVAMGIFGGIGQLMLVLAFGFAPASVLAPFLYSSILFAVTFGFLFFGEVPDGWTLGGAALIVSAGLYIRYREHRLLVALHAREPA